MTQDVVQALSNGIAVTAGLFVLWSFVGRMREVGVSARLGWALVAGIISGLVALVVRMFI